VIATKFQEAATILFKYRDGPKARFWWVLVEEAVSVSQNALKTLCVEAFVFRYTGIDCY